MRMLLQNTWKCFIYNGLQWVLADNKFKVSITVINGYFSEDCIYLFDWNAINYILKIEINNENYKKRLQESEVICLKCKVGNDISVHLAKILIEGKKIVMIHKAKWHCFKITYIIQKLFFLLLLSFEMWGIYNII